nr:MAG TPA: hypothetical protein [Caudoviricetes sp.]
MHNKKTVLRRVRVESFVLKKHQLIASADYLIQYFA